MKTKKQYQNGGSSSWLSEFLYTLSKLIVLLFLLGLKYTKNLIVSRLGQINLPDYKFEMSFTDLLVKLSVYCIIYAYKFLRSCLVYGIIIFRKTSLELKGIMLDSLLENSGQPRSGSNVTESGSVKNGYKNGHVPRTEDNQKLITINFEFSQKLTVKI